MALEVELRITDEVVELRAPGTTWRKRVANRIVTRPDKGNRRVVVAIGDEGREGVEADGTTATAVFRAPSLDIDVADAATLYWTWEALTQAHGQSWRRYFRRSDLSIVWPAWSRIPIDVRRQFLRRAAGRANVVVVNGHTAARYPALRRWLGLAPLINP